MSVTSANSILMLSVASLYPVAQQIQGFASDDIFSIEPQETAEVMMGVDGVLTGGFVYAMKRVTYSLMADSASIEFFDTWFEAQHTIADLYYATGTHTLPSLGKKYSLTKGILSNYQRMPNAARTLQARRFVVTWQGIGRAPV